jgi:cytidyltransferase-like protein
MPRSGRIVLGGTFDRLHAGHEAMLASAFQAGRRVSIGLTSARYLADHPKPAGGRIQGYSERRAALVRWLSARYPRSRWAVVPISDAFGGSVGDGVTGLVVTPDTLAGGRAVNVERQRRGRRPVPLLIVPLVLGDDLLPISSRRVRHGEIDRRGRRLAPIRVAVVAAGDLERRAAVRAVARTFPRAQIVRRSSPHRSEGPRARGRPELTVSVRRDSARRRSVRISTRWTTLRWTPVPADAGPTLARAIERLLRRSGSANR